MNQNIFSPELVGLSPVGAVDLGAIGSLYALPPADYGVLANEKRRKVADSEYYSFAEPCHTLTQQMAEAIVTYSTPSPLSEVINTVADGLWRSSYEIPVLGAPDYSAFSPACCDMGRGPSMKAAVDSVKTIHQRSFSVSFTTCKFNVARAEQAGQPVDRILQQQVIETINYGSSLIAMRGGFGIEGFAENPSIPAVYLPQPFGDTGTTGPQIMSSIASVLQSLDLNMVPSGGYTLLLPNNVMRGLIRPYGGPTGVTASIKSVLEGRCACPGSEVLGGLITSMVSLPFLQGIAPGIGSGNMAMLIPNDRRFVYWQRPVPYEFLEPENCGYKTIGTAVCHIGPVIVLRPLHCVRIYNV